MPEFIWRWRREIVFSLLVIISIGMLVAHHQPGLISRSVNQGGAFIIVPFQKLISSVVKRSQHSFTFFTSIRSLRQENSELKRKVEKLTLRNALLKENMRENELLREALQYKNKKKIEFIPAEVIGRDAASWLNRAVLDRGSADGVKVGAGVLSPKGIVGRIVEVNLYSSTLMLLPDTQSSVAGLSERSRIAGTITGTGDRQLKMLYVSSGDDIKKGDTIVTSKLSSLFPAGLPIGDVVMVSPSDNGLMLDIKITPRVMFKTIDRFLILKVEDEED